MTRFSRLFDENRSIWLADKEPYESAPALARDLSVDVAVIGAGFTGISTAYHLSERFPDLGIAVLEAKVVANGASGRNGGQMLNWAQDFESQSPEVTHRVYQATREGIESILSIIERHRLSVSHRRDGHLDLYTDPRNADAAAAKAAALGASGLPVRFLDRSELRGRVELEGVEGAVLDPEGGQLDGVGYLRGLRPVLEQRGVRFFENTPVVAIREGRSIELETLKATVRARAIVLATNAYTPHLGYFRRSIVPIHSHVVGTEARSPERWAELGWKQYASFTDDRGRLSYGTLAASDRLLFGGGSNETYDYVFGNKTALGRPPERGYRHCYQNLLAYLPRVREVPVTHRWSGPVAVTLSRIGTMGVRGEHRNVYYALGYSGHGVTLANLAGKILCDLYGGAGERWRDLPFLERRLRYLPPEPFRWLGYQAYTRLTGRSPRIRS